MTFTLTHRATSGGHIQHEASAGIVIEQANYTVAWSVEGVGATKEAAMANAQRAFVELTELIRKEWVQPYR